MDGKAGSEDMLGEIEERKGDSSKGRGSTVTTEEMPINVTFNWGRHFTNSGVEDQSSCFGVNFSSRGVFHVYSYQC